MLANLVITATAAVLAHPDPAAMDPEQPFKDLGIDSLSALELRNTLSAQTGVALPATVTFDHPSPRCSPPTSPTCCASPLCPRVRRPRSPRVTPSRWTIGSRTWIKPRSWGCGQDTCRCCR
ncbi:phosphopantetheine attachment site family protein [Mycobacterium kansasii]|uniref:Phosphopantetheine attachment site family protein n=1 Tax=Mycobacterium kansasii TaxID=1768 RepID=A0A1V3WKU0_MYCKA|nr:phosphopantetheine attachment site family protein [Mycobacterium kansasii]